MNPVVTIFVLFVLGFRNVDSNYSRSASNASDASDASDGDGNTEESEDDDYDDNGGGDDEEEEGSDRSEGLQMEMFEDANFEELCDCVNRMCLDEMEVDCCEYIDSASDLNHIVGQTFAGNGASKAYKETAINCLCGLNGEWATTIMNTINSIPDNGT